MPHLTEIPLAAVAVTRRGEDLLGLHVQEAKPHGAMPHDAFQMSDTSTAAEALLGIERHHRVACLPDAVCVRIAAETNTVAQIPDANCTVKRIARSGDARRQCVVIIERNHRHIDAARAQTPPQLVYEMQTLDLT